LAFAIEIFRNSPARAIQGIIAEWTIMRTISRIDDFGVLAFSGCNVARISSAFLSIVAVLIFNNAFDRHIVLNFAMSLLTWISFAITSRRMLFTSIILVEFASFFGTISHCAFISSSAFGIVWDVLALTIFRIACIYGARYSIIAVHKSVGASEFRIADIFGAHVVIVTRFCNVKATNDRIADINGAFVVVVTKVSLVRVTFRNGFIADSNFVFHASKIATAFFVSFSLAVCSHPNVSALTNVLFVAFSFL
jgi:hypothetical protein